MKKIIDGKIDENQYDNALCKILWILKEANISQGDKEKKIDICEAFREDWHIKNALAVPTFRKMIYATYGILNPSVEWQDVPFANKEAYNVIKQIAYININKYPANSRSNDVYLKKVYDDNKIELLQQINELNPNVIVFGNTFMHFEYEDLDKIGCPISKTEKKYADDTTHNTAYYKISSDKLCINAYHPSYPSIADKVYYNEIRKAFSDWKSNK